ncbi:MAG: Asd/ArgC dimerization domain-containing protein [Bryobacteraceae bacterium]
MTKPATVALVGSESLLGREVRDLAANEAGFTLRLLAADREQAGTIARVGDEPSIVEELTAESFEGARVAVLAGEAQSCRRALELAERAGIAVVDLTGVAEELPDARLRAPLVEEAEPEAEGGIEVIAHPAAVALALFLRRLHAHEPVARAVVQIFAPASEHGTKGVEELQQQTVHLLSFKPLPQKVFDAQTSFNMLARYGAGAPLPLEEAELRIERHLATLLALAGDGEGVPLPSLRLVQAPVFHGYSMSVWVELESNPGVDALESALLSPSIDVRGGDFEPPTNVGQAGQDGIAVGAIALDRNSADACWFWLVADNLRLTAENGVAVVRQLV